MWVMKWRMCDLGVNLSKPGEKLWRKTLLNLTTKKKDAVDILNRRNLVNTHTHPFNGPFSRTTRVTRYQKDKTNLDFTEARDSEWQWHQLGHMQVCISLQITTPAPHCSVFYRPDALPAAQPTASKHWMLLLSLSVKKIKSVNIWKSYKQEHGCLMHWPPHRLATTPLKVHETTTLLLVTLANIHTTL